MGKFSTKYICYVETILHYLSLHLLSVVTQSEEKTSPASLHIISLQGFIYKILQFPQRLTSKVTHLIFSCVDLAQFCHVNLPECVTLGLRGHW